MFYNIMNCILNLIKIINIGISYYIENDYRIIVFIVAVPYGIIRVAELPSDSARLET